jgi:hypothetical protein
MRRAKDRNPVIWIPTKPSRRCLVTHEKSSAEHLTRLRLLSLRTAAFDTFYRELFVLLIGLPNNTIADTYFMTTKLERVVYARITTEDYRALNILADERQQTISQLIRKILIDSGVLNR